jgi:hypothetical protein
MVTGTDACRATFSETEPRTRCSRPRHLDDAARRIGGRDHVHADLEVGVCTTQRDGEVLEARAQLLGEMGRLLAPRLFGPQPQQRVDVEQDQPRADPVDDPRRLLERGVAAGRQVMGHEPGLLQHPDFSIPTSATTHLLGRPRPR